MNYTHYILIVLYLSVVPLAKANNTIRFDFSRTISSRLGTDTAIDKNRSKPLKNQKKSNEHAVSQCILGEEEVLKLNIERPYARPGERWIEVGVQLDTSIVPLEQLSIEAAIFKIGSSKPVATSSIALTRQSGLLFVDLRTRSISKARLSVKLLKDGKFIDAVETFLEANHPIRFLKPGEKIPVLVDLPKGISKIESWPVTFGVPFPEGSLWDIERLRLVDRDGCQIPFQKEITGRWAPEGAIKWVRFDALVSSSQGCFVEVAPAVATDQFKQPVRVIEKNGNVILDNDITRYVLAKGRSPIDEVWLGNNRIVTAGPRGLYVVDQNGRVASATSDQETMEIESHGPVAACVRFEGYYKTGEGDLLARHITRVEVFAGQPFAKVTHTMVLTNDTNKVWFRDIGWEFSVTAGAKPKAVFNTSSSDWQKKQEEHLSDGMSAYMLQDKHFFFDHGKNHFEVGTQTGNGKVKKSFEGDECGDWSLLTGNEGGLMVSCKEAARQHPKEFEVFEDRLVLHLFSGRAGEELDFRTETLVKKWDLFNWYTRTLGATPEKVDEYLKTVGDYNSNAIGWAKTHQIMISPLPPDKENTSSAYLPKLYSTQVYAIVDPEWICQSKTFGAIHPKDPERFPILEKVIETAFRMEEASLRKWGDYGFVDYFAGPHYQNGNMRRYDLTYTLRGDLWLAYARSGDRRIRTFIEKSDASYMDNSLSHWDGPDRIKGMLHSAGGDSWEGYGKGALPFYWEGASRLEKSSTTNLDNFIWMYHLTGYRRASDVVLEYIEGLKRFWTPEKAKNSWRSIMAMRMIIQAYGFTWDPELRLLADATADAFEDPEGELYLSKDRPYKSGTYKTQVDIAALLDAWEITSSPRYYRMCRKVAEYWWQNTLGEWPIFYTNPQGRIGAFLYQETGNLSYAEGLNIQLRQAATLYDPNTDAIKPYGRSAGTFIYQGIPYAQHVVAETNADKKHLTSWVGYEEFEEPCSIVIHKPDQASVRVNIKRTDPLFEPGAVGGTQMHAVTKRRSLGQSLNSLLGKSSNAVTVHLPKDSEEGGYEVISSNLGRSFVLADSKIPVVVHATGYWRPYPAQMPPVRWFFQIPENVEKPQIFFEHGARLFDADGHPAFDRKKVKGWVDLPPDRPGLWAFESSAIQLIKARNLPPFFAAGDRKNYFLPDISWTKEQIEKKKLLIQSEAEYQKGAVNLEGNKALYLGQKSLYYLKIKSGAEQLFPLQEGTIEFWFKPRWSTFDLPQNITKVLLKMETSGSPWTLTYLKRSKNSTRYPSNNLYGQFYIQGRTKRLRVPAYRPIIFEKDRWTHIAWVWGLRKTATPRGRKQLLYSQIFLDGKAGTKYVFNREGFPTDVLRTLILGPNLKATIDELRFSNIQRYTVPFSPKELNSELKMDKYTCALFHFNGDLKGESHLFNSNLSFSVMEK